MYLLFFYFQNSLVDALWPDGFHHGSDDLLPHLSDARDRFFPRSLLQPAYGEPRGISTRREGKKEGLEATTGT